MQYFVAQPHVSIVIINWNYGQYVAEAIRSVKDQSYRAFDCLVIDNGSADRSADIIAATIDGDPQFTFHQLPENLGHLGAMLWSLDRLRGEFVTFLDADDFLFPEFIANHLQVHLGSRFPTGLTCSNCLDVNAASAQLTGGNTYLRQCWEQGVSCLWPIERAVRHPAFDEAGYAALADATRYMSHDVRGWFWCPTSSNMFRRALLQRVRPKVASPKVFGGVDGFYIPILHAITGTNLIDRALSAYRIHGNNEFSLLPPLMGVRSSNCNAEALGSATLRLAIISMIDGFEDLPVSTDRFWEMLDVVRSSDNTPQTFRHPDIKAAFARRYSALAQFFGESAVLRRLRRLLSVADVLEIASRDRNGAQRWPTFRKLASIEIRHQARRILKRA